MLPSTYAISRPRTSTAYVTNGIDKRAFFGNEDGNLQPNRTDATADRDPEVIGDLNVRDIVNDDGVGSGPDEYNVYTGNGTTEAGWPKLTEWISFENMYISCLLRLPLILIFGTGGMTTTTLWSTLALSFIPLPITARPNLKICAPPSTNPPIKPALIIASFSQSSCKNRAGVLVFPRQILSSAILALCKLITAQQHAMKVWCGILAQLT